MKNREVKTCVAEMLDTLYNKKGFSKWWDELKTEEEEEIESELFKNLRKRIDKSLEK